jgi:hypothetical protein
MVEQRLARFDDRDNARRPSRSSGRWKFTTTDLDDILYRLDRLDRRERADTTNASQPMAA